MEFYQLRTFLVVAAEKSVTRAARRLYATPPSISSHIKALEDEWNVKLFRRTGTGMEITEKGRELLSKAEATLLAAQDLSNHATDL
jgi:DNA-binding transcriptional LysR family regulator